MLDDLDAQLAAAAVERDLDAFTDALVTRILELRATRTLDVVDREMTLDQIGAVLGVTRERIRQLVAHATERLQRAARDLDGRGTR